MVMEHLGDGVRGLTDALPELPKLTRTVEIPVYVVHRSRDADDYILLLDFEAFGRDARTGVFTRPVLKVWAGRRDFSRAIFARHLREVFSTEFERMRAEVDTPKSGWFRFGLGDALSLGAVTNLIGTLVLYVAVSTGRAAVSALASYLSLDRWLKGPDPRARLEADIAEKKRVVDAALAELEVTLHRELYVHAYRGEAPGPLSGMDYDAWPLPPYVRAHLEDERSGSWW